jgi:hypothetical protein
MNEPTSEETTLLDHDCPQLPDGCLTVKVTQTVTGKDVPFTSSVDRKVVVRGPQFSLLPQDILSVYPPPGSAGPYDKVVPHVILARSTLPWERSPDTGGADRSKPWLALLVLDEADGVSSQNVPLTDASPDGIYAIPLSRLSPDGESYFPWRPVAKNDPKNDPMVQVIKLARKRAETFLPPWSDLHLLAHVRRTKRPEAPPERRDTSRAVVVAHPGLALHQEKNLTGRMSAHLVSLEKWYDKKGNLAAPPGKAIFIVVLKSWTFVRIRDQKPSFEQVADRLAHGSGTLRLPQVSGDPANADAEHFLAQGAAALPHLRRSGKVATSLYHGPLAPWRGANTTRLPTVGGAVRLDDLIARSRHPALGVSDVSYVAAWELGRLRMLHDPGAARRLFNWKCELLQSAATARLSERNRFLATEHLPMASFKIGDHVYDVAGPRQIGRIDAIHHCHWIDVTWLATGSKTLGIDAVNLRCAAAHPFPDEWFDQLVTMEGVPFAYLVPDERMLRRGTGCETVRFFEVERAWIEALVCGAFSVGAVSGSRGGGRERSIEAKLDAMQGELRTRICTRSGLLLRSSLVSDWPELRVETDLPAGEKNHIVRRLSKDVELHLFSGTPSSVQLSTPRELLHFEWTGDKKLGDYTSSSDVASQCLHKGHQIRFNLQPEKPA